jgi:hypothetical protein
MIRASASAEQQHQSDGEPAESRRLCKGRTTGNGVPVPRPMRKEVIAHHEGSCLRIGADARHGQVQRLPRMSWLPAGLLARLGSGSHVSDV